MDSAHDIFNRKRTDSAGKKNLEKYASNRFTQNAAAFTSMLVSVQLVPYVLTIHNLAIED